MVPADSLVLAGFILLLVVITYVIFKNLQGKVQNAQKVKKNIPGVPTPGRIAPGKIIPGVPTPGAPVSPNFPVIPVPGGNIRSY